jgi:hypothetical protein
MMYIEDAADNYKPMIKPILEESVTELAPVQTPQMITTSENPTLHTTPLESSN